MHYISYAYVAIVSGDVLMAEQSEIWEGGCLCGAVTYESSRSPISENSGNCHCRKCQKDMMSLIINPLILSSRTPRLLWYSVIVCL